MTINIHHTDKLLEAVDKIVGQYSLSINDCLIEFSNSTMCDTHLREKVIALVDEMIKEVKNAEAAYKEN